MVRIPLQYWNMHGITRRTNNNLEGWHSGLKKSVGKSHANIYEFASKLLLEHESSVTMLAQIGAGNVSASPVNKLYARVNRQIDECTTSYQNGETDADAYTRGVAHNLAQPKFLSL